MQRKIQGQLRLPVSALGAAGGGSNESPGPKIRRRAETPRAVRPRCISLPDQQGVAMPNGFHSSGKLDPGPTTTLNSKRGQAFSSTAIEHHSHARSKGGPEQAKRFGTKRDERIARNGQAGCVQPMWNERINGVLYFLAPLGRPPADCKQLVGQFRTHPDQRRQQLEPHAIAKVGERTVRRIFHELDRVLHGVGHDLRPADADQRPHHPA